MLEDSVLGLGQDPHQRLRIQRLQGGDHRHTSHQFGDQTVLHQILRDDLPQQRTILTGFLRLYLIAKAQRAGADPLFDRLGDAVKGTAQNEQDIGGVDLNELLLGVLPSAVGRHVGDRSFQDLQQRLLHALAADIPGNGWIFAAAGDLIDLIHIDDPPLRPFHVVVRRLNEPQENVFHILAHISGLGQGRGIRNGKGHVQRPCQRLCQRCLSHTGGTQQQHIAFAQLRIGLAAVINALIVIIHRHGQGDLCFVLSDDVFIQLFFDFTGCRQLFGDLRFCSLFRRLTPAFRRRALLVQQRFAQINTLVADIDAGTGDQTLHFPLPLSAKGAAHLTTVFFVIRQISSPP